MVSRPSRSSLASASSRPRPRPVVDRSAVVDHAAPRERGDLPASATAASSALAVVDHAVDEADALGLVGVDLPPGEDEVEGPAEADDARQAVGAAVDERHAPPPLEAAEAGRRAGDAQVAPGRQLDPAGHAPPLDGGDDRLRQLEAGRARAAPTGRRGGQVLEVGAGAERRARRR